MAAAAALAVLLAAFVYFFRGDFGGLRALVRDRPPGWRRRRYRMWIAKSWLLFAAPAIIGLLLAGRGDALRSMPDAFLPLAMAAGYPIPADLLVMEVLAGLAGGLVLGGGLTLIRRLRGKPPVMLGDFSVLVPRTPAELLLAGAAALSAGVTEELYFRLAVPLLAADLTGSAPAGLIVATALFGLAHRYQRWPGVVATTLAGLLFAFLYLQSGALWVAMLVHAGVDLNALVVRPLIGGQVRRGRAG